MAREPLQRELDAEQVVSRLKDRVAKERAAGSYPDDLADVELPLPPASEDAAAPSIAQGFDLGAAGPRVRFRPELGFSTKPVIGAPITLVKRFILRLLFHVFDDLARQTDAAIARVEAALAVEIATRERLESDLREVESRLAQLEGEREPSATPETDA